MSTTPMASDSPMGNGLTGKVNAVQPTAMVSEMISLYRPTKHFRREKGSSQSSTIVSLDFDDEGGLLLTSEGDNSMQMYNIKEGKHHKSLLSQKYGVSHAMFGHATGYTIRYLSTHDNSYLRYFEGHEDTVTCLSLHPGQDNFISCSVDNTLRIWDASTKNSCGKLLLNGAYLSAWDPSGNVFAVASPSASTILLYDFRNYDKEPFSTFDILPYSQEMPMTASRGWNKLEFSNDGKHILLGTTGPAHLLLDAFDGHLKASLRRERGGVRRLCGGDRNPEDLGSQSAEYLHPTTGDACFSPDGRYVVSGSKQQNVLVWDTLTAVRDTALTPVHELDHKGDSAVIAFNPRYNFFATGDKEVVFWVPDQSLA